MNLKVPGVIFLFTFCLLASCRRDKDAEEPIITINEPIANSTFSALDTFTVSGIVTDDRKLEYLSIKLLTSDMTSANTPVTIHASGSSYTISYPYILDDISLPGGSHYLKVEAFDGSNLASEYIPIAINEIPKRKTHVALASTSGGLSTELYLVDNNWTTSQLSVLHNHDLLSIGVQSVNQNLLVLGTCLSGLTRVKLSNAQNTVLTTTACTPPSLYYRSMHVANNLFYVCEQSGFAKAFDDNGAIKFSGSASSGYIPLRALPVGNYVFLLEMQAGGAIQRINQLFGTSGTSKAVSQALSFDVVDWFGIDNEILLAGNNGNTGEIWQWNAGTNTFWQPANFDGGNILCAAQISSGYFMISAVGGMYLYNSAGPGMVQINTINNCYKIIHDPVENLAYCLRNGAIDVVKISSGDVLYTYSTGMAVSDMALIYNK